MPALPRKSPIGIALPVRIFFSASFFCCTCGVVTRLCVSRTRCSCIVVCIADDRGMIFWLLTSRAFCFFVCNLE